MNNESISPLRYPGSKRSLVLYLEEILKHNHLSPRIIVEPFFGGGSVSLHFLLNKKVKKIIVGDKDKVVYSFWHTLFKNPKHLIKFVEAVKIDLNTFNKYKHIANNADDYKEIQLAEACLFLNRTSFSGILRKEAGPIGGKTQKSEYKINCRFNKKAIIEKIKNLSKLKNKVIVLPYDWKDTLKFASKFSSKKDVFYYFDPPFYHKADKLYRAFFSKQDHEELCKFVVALKKNWILSYDKAPEIKKMYSKFKKMHIEMPYSINSHAVRIEKEIIITPLNLPKIKNKKSH